MSIYIDDEHYLSQNLVNNIRIWFVPSGEGLQQNHPCIFDTMVESIIKLSTHSTSRSIHETYVSQWRRQKEINFKEIKASYVTWLYLNHSQTQLYIFHFNNVLFIEQIKTRFGLVWFDFLVHWNQPSWIIKW